SSRRRHTRFSRDWSSDVCSSDLSALTEGQEIKSISSYQNLDAGLWAEFLKLSLNAKDYSDSVFNHAKVYLNPQISKNTFEKMIRSEERRVGKECRYRCTPYH